jgi:hypothetical protein
MSDEELIAKLEVAMEASVELDGLIAMRFREMPPAAKYELVNMHGQHVDHWYGGHYGAYEFYHPEAYTSSIDAVVDLIGRELLPGTIWRASNDETQGAGVLVPTERPHGGIWYQDSTWVGGSARLASLALVIAVIRVAPSQQEGNQG